MFPPKTLAIFGSFPTLSAAELFAVFQRDMDAFRAVQRSGAVLDGGLPKPFADLGGLVKAGEIVARPAPWEEAIAGMADPLFLKRFLPSSPGKRMLGVSVYDPSQSAHAVREATRHVGRLLKGAASRLGGTARWVASRERVLSSVVVATNHLLDRGAEFLLLRDGNAWWVGRTTAVQDFRRYGKRDYGRPQRDDASGMLPPKLAQILLNLSGAQGNVPLLDPFCGSGTVLMEALLMGFQDVYGSDRSAEAVSATEANLGWLRKHEPVPHRASWRVARADVRQIDRAFPNVRFGAIVTEPYLGPQRRLSLQSLPTVSKALTALYRDAFRAFARVLVPGGMVAIVFPAFFFDGDGAPHLLPAADIARDGFTPVPLLPRQWRAVFPEAGSARPSLLYRRPGQKVGRELFLFRRT